MPRPPRILAVLLLAACVLVAEDGVTDAEVLIGQSVPLSGASAEVGASLSQGLSVALNEANVRGGVQGRRLRLLALDDGYEPGRCLDMSLRLIEDDKVFCLAGLIGTPSAKVVEPILAETRVPLVGVRTGADLTRTPVKRYIINVRASYSDEAEQLVDHLTRDLGLKRIAVLYQDDTFGRSVLAGISAALTRRGLPLAGKASQERGSLEMAAPVAAIAAASPDGVILVGTAKPAVAFAKQLHTAKLDVVIGSSSYVNADVFIRDLGPLAEGIALTQILPPPSDASLPLVRDYQKALAAVAPDQQPSYAGLEGYLYGRVLVMGLERAGRDLTREHFVDAIDGISDANLGGMSIAFTKANHQATSQVFLTQVSGGVARPVATLSARARPSEAAPAPKPVEGPRSVEPARVMAATAAAPSASSPAAATP